MYSKQEASKIRQLFWTSFGLYMKPVPSATGEKVNWPNYKTGISHIYFRMRAERKAAFIGIEFTHPAENIRQQQYAQMLSMKALLESHTGEHWIWERDAADENGRPLSRVFMEMDDVSVFNQADWPRIISFFKPRLIALDAFWEEVRPAFA